MLYIVLMHISHFILFANDLLLAVYYIFILDCGSDVKQKTNSSDFLIQVQKGRKAVVTTHNINNAFGPGTANKSIVQWWFKKFCKGDENLEDEECNGLPLEVDNNQLRAIIKAGPFTNIIF